MVNVTEIKPLDGFQVNAVDCPADIAIIGGSAGCGKTFCLLFDPLQYIFSDVEGFNGIIFRRDSVDIRTTGGLWDKAKSLYKMVPPNYRPREYGGNTHFKFKFPNSCEIQLGHLHDVDTVYSYQGTEISYIAFDELTHFTQEQFFYMLSRNRSTSGVVPYVRASTNPQGEGWVKDLISPWIYPDDYEIEILRGAPIPEMQGVCLYMARLDGKIIMKETAQEVLDAMDSETAKSFPIESIRTITFVAGKLFENTILMKSNPGYVGNLLGLSENERLQLLDGRWINIDNDATRLYTSAAISDLFTNFVNPSKNRYITADIALEGSDKFVIAIWQGWVLVELRVFPKTMGDQVLAEIQRAAKDWQVPIRHIAFDHDGVGGFLKGFLRTAFAFNGNASPINESPKVILGKKTERPNYFNLRSQVYFYLREIIENSEMLIQNAGIYQKEIEQELKAIKKMETRQDTKLRIIPKSQIKEAIGRSPDFADVIAMRSVFDLVPRVAIPNRKVSSF